MTLEPTPDHAALLRLLVIQGHDVPEIIKTVRYVGSLRDPRERLWNASLSRDLVRMLRSELDGIEHLLDLTIERLDP